MSDLKLRSVSIRNWMTIRKADLEFPEKGLVLVVGNNIASGGKMESVGSGKTALGEALSRALVGTRGRFTQLGHYSHKSKGNMCVKVVAELAGKPLVVEIGHKCKELNPSGEGIRFQHGDKPPTQHGKPQETRDELTSILGVSPELAACTVFIDGDKLRFNDQSERSSVNLLMTALRQPSWDDYQKRAGLVLNDAKSKFEHASGVHAVTQQEITDTEECLQQARKDLKNEATRLVAEEKTFKEKASQVSGSIAANEETITRLKARQKEIKSILKKLEENNAQTYHSLELEKATFSTLVSQQQIKRTSLIEDRAGIKSEWSAANADLTEMKSEPEKCPTCGKKWDKEHSAGEVSAQEKKVVGFKAKYDAKNAEITIVDETISGINSDISGVDTKIRELRAPQRNQVLSLEYERNDEGISGRTTDNTALKLRLQTLQQGPNRSEYERLTTIVQERQKTATEAENALKDAAEGMVQAEALVKVAAYWYEAFGPTGIPNMILTEAIKPLNEIAKRISLMMTGGTIDINYGTTRELVSGNSKAELVINVNNKIGSTRAEGSSKGESGLTNLIIAETLSEVGSVSNRIGYRWYDEILNSQDQVVRRSILSYLKNLAHRLNILVFVVDHHQEAASYADYVLIAEKSDKGTELFWR